MKLGFTGTRKGMTVAQKATVERLLIELHSDSPGNDEDFVHHGDCLGADWELVDDCVNPVKWFIVAHPSNIKGMTGHAYADERHEPKPPLARNRDIVNACETLLACPEGPETPRSGTWATVRYARKQRKPVLIVWPDGTALLEANKP